MDNNTNLQDLLKAKTSEFEAIKAKAAQMDQQIASINDAKQKLLLTGVEIQGQLKLLGEMAAQQAASAETPAPAVVETEVVPAQ